MLQALFIFVLSAVFSLIILYILGIVWFGDKRSRSVQSFFVMGVIAAYWIIFNGLLAVAGNNVFPALLSIGMIFVCILPFALLWFSLHYTKSSLIHSKKTRLFVIALPVADILMMLTSPGHKLYFTDYSFPIPGKGILFWVHVAFGLGAVFMSFILITEYALKAPRLKGHALFAGLGIFISAGMHIWFALDPLVTYDLSSIGFFVTFLLFAFSAHKSRIFSLRRMGVDQIFSSCDDMFFILDEDGNLIERNAASNSLSRRFASLSEDSGIDTIIDSLSCRLLSCEPSNLLSLMSIRMNNCTGEVRLATHDGLAKTYTLQWRAIERDSILRGYVLSLSDMSFYRDMIDESNRKNERLARLSEEAMSASKAKSAFLANMSHEIRTPLNSVIGMSQIAKQSIDDREKTAASIDKVLHASRHLLELINNILDMSKIESGKFALASEPFSPKNALNEVVDIFTQRCDEKSISLISKIDELPKMVIGDSLRLKQVIINLLGNAVKFTEPDGRISLQVDAKESADHLKLSVSISDTGIGMSPDQLSHLFTPFEQADSSITARYGGTGIGLALSQHLVGLMGGIIKAESQLSHGSVFSFALELPIAPDTACDNDLKQKTPSLPDLSGKRVLIADDIAVNRIIMSEFLSDTNATIEEAEDGARAVNLFSNSPEQYYDLIFMDIQMPNTDGYEAARQIRSMSRNDAGRVPIVAMTANAYREDVEKALASGMNAHLAKPLDIDRVHALISQLIPN